MGNHIGPGRPQSYRVYRHHLAKPPHVLGRRALRLCSSLFVTQATDRHHITVNLPTGLQVSEEHRHLRQASRLRSTFHQPEILQRWPGSSPGPVPGARINPNRGLRRYKSTMEPWEDIHLDHSTSDTLGTPVASDQFPRQWAEVISSRLLGISPVGHAGDCDGSVGRLSFYRQHQRQVVERSLSTPQCSPLRRYR